MFSIFSLKLLNSGGPREGTPPHFYDKLRPAKPRKIIFVTGPPCVFFDWISKSPTNL